MMTSPPYTACLLISFPGLGDIRPHQVTTTLITNNSYHQQHLLSTITSANNIIIIVSNTNLQLQLITLRQRTEQGPYR